MEEKGGEGGEERKGRGGEGKGRKRRVCSIRKKILVMALANVLYFSVCEQE